MAYASLEGGGYPNLAGQAPQVPSYAPAPQPLNHQGDANHGGFGHWSDSLTSFSDCGNCLMACCLPPVRQAQTAARADIRSFWNAIMMFVGPIVLSVIFLIVAAAESSRINKNKKAIDDIPGYEDYVCYPKERGNAKIAIFVVLGLAAAILYWVMAARLRTALRVKYNIPGTPSEDCILFASLGCCAVAQEARHTDRVIGRLPVVPLRV